MFARQAIQRDYQLVFQKDFAKWCSEHSHLLAILNRYNAK
jgi:hypothetical protein